MADTGSNHHTPRLTPQEVATLGRLVELDLRGQAINLADVCRVLENGARQGSPLYRAGAEGSDAQASRIVRAAKATRQERLDTARALRTACLFDDGGTYCYTHETWDAHPLVTVPGVPSVPGAYAGQSYRKGSTMAVVSGPHVGLIGRLVAVGANGNYVLDSGTFRGSVTVHHSNLVRAPHPFGWYQRVQASHGPCAGCDSLQAAMVPVR